MAQALYDVVFYGEVLAGFSRDEVKQAFARSFKLSDRKAEQLFSGRQCRLRTAQEETQARDYLRRLERLGARAHLEACASSVAPAPLTETNAGSSDHQSGSPPADTGRVPAPMPVVVHAGEPATEQNHHFRFHGSGSEYFRIWIVNILLSIVTLGIYSAWAKVRNKQYFYGNTELNGSSFTYLANPVAILKGRLIALTLVVAYSVATSTPLWWVSAIAVLVAILMAPFFVQRSLMFNARYSAWRNVRFNFDGSFWAAVLIFAGLPLASLVFIGLMAEQLVLGESSVLLMIGPTLLVLVMVVPYFIYWQKRYWVSNSMYGTSRFQFGADSSQFLRLWLKLLLCSAAAALLGGLILALLGALAGVSIAALGGEESRAGTALVVPLLLLVYVVIGLCYLFPFIYFSVRVNNLVYNSTRLGDFRLQANYQLLSYGKLVVINSLLTLLTLGLFRPFAMVRTARYRAGHTLLLAAAPLDGFVAQELEQVGALGEELGDFYDFDFGF